MELNFNEKFIIEVIRNFDFLRQFKYDIMHVSVFDRDPSIIFLNKKNNRKIYIGWEGKLILSIERNRFFITKNEGNKIYIDEYFDLLNDKSVINLNKSDPFELIKSNAELLKGKLLPLIEGRLWITEILKGKNS